MPKTLRPSNNRVHPADINESILRVRVAAIIAACGFVAYAFVDRVVAPQSLYALFGVRGITVAAIIVLWAFAGHSWARANTELLAIMFFSVVCVGIIACSAIAGGAVTVYHEPLALMFICYAGFLPASIRRGTVALTAIMTLHEMVMVGLGIQGDAVIFVQILAVLCLAGVISVGFIYANSVLKERALHAKLREEEMRKLLQQSHDDLIQSVDQLNAANEKLNHANSQLKQLDEAKNAFFANVSHELRTPLMLILATLEGIRDDAVNAGGNPHQFEVGRRNGLRLLRMVDDLLELSRLESASAKLCVADVDLAILTKNFVEQMQPMADRKKIVLTYSGCPSAPAQVDPGAIEKIINNLISNALKFTPTGGRIVVDVQGEDPVNIAVTDNGVGISEADKKHVFERFYQGASGKGVKGGGVGIGLSMCKRIAEMHGGKISLDSAPGSGTTVLVALPKEPIVAEGAIEMASDPSTQLTDAKSGLPEWDRRIRSDPQYKFVHANDASERRSVLRTKDENLKSTSVLLIEDNRDMLEQIHSWLVDEHRVYVAGDGAEGLDLARRFRPDVIISDITMPVMGGFALLEKLRQDPLLLDVPVVLMTARGSKTADRDTSDTLEADAFLPKPFTAPQLRAIVGRLLKRQKALAAQAIDTSLLSNRIAAAGLAHDILNPVGFIKSAAYVMEKGYSVLIDPAATDAARAKAKAKMLDALRSTKAGVDRIVECVELLRSTADGHTTTGSEPLDVNSIIQRTLAVTAVTTTVKTSLSSTRNVVLKRGQLDRVLLNLVLNAIQAGGEGCNICIESYNAPDQQAVVIVVHDNGPGMDPHTLLKATEPYFSDKEDWLRVGTGYV